jgi:Asp/Glu/hydantoin racemase
MMRILVIIRIPTVAMTEQTGRAARAAAAAHCLFR